MEMNISFVATFFLAFRDLSSASSLSSGMIFISSMIVTSFLKTGAVSSTHRSIIIENFPPVGQDNFTIDEAFVFIKGNFSAA